MKKTRKFLTVVLIIAAVFVAVRVFPLYKEYSGASVYTGQQIEFDVKEGETVSTVASKLEQMNIIKSKYSFILRHKHSPKNYTDVKFGTYVIKHGMNLDDIIYTLTATGGKSDAVQVLIPEGFSAEMIGQRLENNGLCTKADFLDSIENDTFDYEFINHIPDGDYTYKLEGFLFPSTYELSKDMTPHMIADAMLSAFETAYTDKFSSYDRLFEIMTVASIVEREAVLDSERATIAGVIGNRISKDMLLQVDATVVYAKSGGEYDINTVTYDDLEVDSKYNTYKYKGLTPGPICNPGIKSILAAAKPESHPYLFYHTDEAKKDGSHIFTETFDDHVATMN